MMIDENARRRQADLAALEAQMKNTRSQITRRKVSVKKALDHQHHNVIEALREGLPPKKICRLTGYTPGRISQIRKELGGSDLNGSISMFDLM